MISLNTQSDPLSVLKPMTPTNRRKEIVNIIRRRNRVSVDELAHLLHISRETIRRDLTELARHGKVQKYHGGASLPILTAEGPFQHRMATNVTAKVKIAALAASLISPGETLFIDTGSTTLYFAEKLAETPDLTIITNSPEIAGILSKAGNRSQIFLVGGEYRGDNRQTVGNLAIAQLKTFRAHHTVLAIRALDAPIGIMDANIDEAQIARTMINQSESLIILADSSKFYRIASFEVCPLKQVNHLVCEQAPDDTLLAELIKAEVHIIDSPES